MKNDRRDMVLLRKKIGIKMKVSRTWLNEKEKGLPRLASLLRSCYSCGLTATA